jgi:hypothetical protein
MGERRGSDSGEAPRMWKAPLIGVSDGARGHVLERAAVIDTGRMGAAVLIVSAAVLAAACSPSTRTDAPNASHIAAGSPASPPGDGARAGSTLAATGDGAGVSGSPGTATDFAIPGLPQLHPTPDPGDSVNNPRSTGPALSNNLGIPGVPGVPPPPSGTTIPSAFRACPSASRSVPERSEQPTPVSSASTCPSPDG